MSSPKLSIIIPAYQESERIEETLDKLADYIKKYSLKNIEVVVVVADSPDGTASIARAKSKLFEDFKVVDAGPKVGKGRDVRTGIFEATGDYKLFMDADLATPLHHIRAVQEKIDEGADVIIAVRNLSSIHTGLRKIISAAGNFLVQAMLLPGIPDSQCGFKAFSKEAANELFSRQTILGWGFDMEILAIARMRGYKIAQISAPDWSDKPNGTFEGEVKTAALETLGELFTIVWRKWRGVYKNKHYSYEAYKK